MVAAALPVPPRPVVVSAPWNPRFLELATLGHKTAAAELMWMRTIQVIGDADFDAVLKPQLIVWLEGVNSLDPTLRAPYFLGAVLLIGRRDDGERLDVMLERAEKLAPDDYELPQLRGFIAYFSGLDTDKAAAHYERAASVKGAPGFVAAFAARLRKQGLSCRALHQNLSDIGRADASVRRWLTGDDDTVLRNCITEELRRAAGQYRLLGLGPSPTVDDLIAKGLLAEAPPSPAGECWLLKDGRYVLGPCGNQQ
jgi:hypothetical protein